jgi:hypothetical protein
MKVFDGDALVREWGGLPFDCATPGLSWCHGRVSPGGRALPLMLMGSPPLKDVQIVPGCIASAETYATGIAANGRSVSIVCRYRGELMQYRLYVSAAFSSIAYYGHGVRQASREGEFSNVQCWKPKRCARLIRNLVQDGVTDDRFRSLLQRGCKSRLASTIGIRTLGERKR